MKNAIRYTFVTAPSGLGSRRQAASTLIQITSVISVPLFVEALIMTLSWRLKVLGTQARLVLLSAGLNLLTLPTAAQSSYAAAYTSAAWAGRAPERSTDSTNSTTRFDFPAGDTDLSLE
jgi:hypothetical protein